MIYNHFHNLRPNSKTSTLKRTVLGISPLKALELRVQFWSVCTYKQMLESVLINLGLLF